MSTEPRSAEPSITSAGPTTVGGAGSAARSARPFRTMLYGSIAVFALLAAGLVALNLGQGPRLTSAVMNVQTSVERAGQRLQLEANEVLAPVSDAQVSVSPPVGVTTTTNQTSIQVQFTSILAYNTTYTVTATGVTSASQQAASTFSYSFTTPDAEVYTLDASGLPNGGSRVERSSLTSGGTETVYSAPRIRSFTVLGSTLVVNTIGDDGNDLLDIVPPGGGASIPVQLAGPGVVSDLKSSARSNLFGYTFRPAPSPHYATDDDQLYIYDTTLGQAFSIPVSGPDHELLKVSTWAFVPGTTSLVALDTSGTLYVADALGLLDGSSGAVAVGSAADLLGFIPGTKKLVASTGGGTVSLDFAAVGAPVTAPITLASETAAPTSVPATASDGGSSAPGENLAPRVLDSSGAVVALSPDGATVALFDGTGSRTVFAEPAGGALTGFCVSPNGRYGVAESVTDASKGAAGGVTSSFFSLADGALAQVVAGSDADWCSAG